MVRPRRQAQVVCTSAVRRALVLGGMLLALGWMLLLAGFRPGVASARGVTRTLDGDRVAIHNLVGSLTVLPGEGRSVVAEITPRGADAAGLRIEEGVIRGRTTLRVIYPGKKIHIEDFGGRSTHWVREDGTLDGKVNEGRRIELSGRDGLDARADVVVRVPRGQHVDIYWGHGSGDVRDVNGTLSIDGGSLEVAAARVRGDLRISVGSGAVRVTGGSGHVEVETGSGDVAMSDVEGDALSIETGSGTIRASELDAPHVSLETGSGDIEAEAIHARRAALETGSGNVGLTLTGDAETISVESGSGNLNVRVPRNFGAALHLETGSGEIEADMPIEIRSREKHEIHGTVGDGRGQLQMETGSGNIVIGHVGRE